MKKILLIVPLALMLGAAMAAEGDLDAKVAQMMLSSFKETGIAKLERQVQTDYQKACSSPVQPDDATMKRIEATQLATVQWPSDGNYTGGDWKEGQKIAMSGRGMTWSDKADSANGGGCYNCHGLDPAEMSYGTIGPNLQGYAKVRGDAEEIVKYTWGKLWNAKAYNACSQMPRNGDAGILTEAQIRDVMAYLFDPDSPVNR